MKNLNLIKRLWTDSLEKQSPQRFARFAAMLIMLLTLGVGQVWADELYVRGYGGWNATESNKMTGTSSPWTFTAHWESNGEFKIGTNNWSISCGSITISAFGTEYSMTNNVSSTNMSFPTLPTGGGIYTITVTLESDIYKIKVDKVAEEGNSWIDINAPKVYWDNTNASYSNVAMLNGRVWAGYSQALGSVASALTHISNTNLWYNTSINNVGNAGKYTTTLFVNANWSSWETNVATKRAPYATSYTATNNASLNSNTYLFSAANGNKGATLSRSQLSGGYSELNKTQTIEVYVKAAGGSYTKKTSSWPGTLTPDRYYLSNATTATHVDNTALEASSSVTTTAVLTSAFSLSESSTVTGYTFDGWGTSSSATPAGKNAPYSISSIAGANTICAFFSENTFTVTVNNDGNGSTNVSGAQSNIGQITGISLSTTPNPGKEFSSWEIVSGTGSFAYSTGTSTNTFYPTSAATIRANFRSNRALTVAAGSHVLSVSGSEDPVTLDDVKYEISATSFETGYEFNNWTASPAANATFDNDESATTNVTVHNGSVTVTANAKEILHAITLVDATSPSVSAGCATPVGITAATVFGAAFDHWEATDGITITNDASSSTTITATKAGTVKAVYAQNLYAYVEGRFHIASPSNHSSWTNSYSSGTWGTTCANIQFSYDELTHRFYLYTYATPKELSTQIESNDPYFFIRTSTSSSSVTGGQEYHPSGSNQELTTVNGAKNVPTTTDTYNLIINNTSDNSYYVTLFFDGTKVWYEYMPAVINNVGLSVSRVPPTAPITATPNMYYKGASNKAYCWGVYTDEECTRKVNSVSFTSLGDGKVQFMAPQEQGTYYLKLTVHSSDDCNATIDDEEVVSFTVTTDDMVFFKNVPGWGNVHVYFLGTSDYWDDNLGSGCADRDYGIAHGMTRIGNSDVYYYDYHGNSNVVFSDGKAYIAFTDNYKPNSNNFSECQAVYRGDFSECAAMFVPENWITHYLNNAAYYNRGYWTNYMSTSSGFKLYIWDKTANNADGEHQILATDVLTSSVVGGNTYTYEYDFGDDPYNSKTRPYTYGFKFEGCGGSWYGAEDDMNITKCTDWNLGTDTRKCGISVTVNQKHKFILTLAGDGHVQVSVEYPVSIGDYRLLYDDETQNPHPSQFIRKRANGKDTVAMYVRPSATENLKVQYCTGISGETITWADYAWNSGSAAINVSGKEDGVYNFYLVQDGSGNLSVNTSETRPYTGLYYIRTNCLDGGWNSYKSSDDNLMTYAQYPEEKGYGFNYYKAKWVGTTGTDVTYTIACDFSPALCDTLVADEGNNPLSAEARSLPHTANIRFGWHSKTNKMTRAYINGSTNVSDRFLVMIGDEKLKDKDGNALSISGLNANEISFSDLNNWIYRCDITAVEGAAVKLTANYDSHVQYFIGTSEKPEEILGGTGSKEYLMRVTYDFKTNRLMTAWLPNGNQITGDVELKADMMLIREGQNAATQVYFNGNDHKITEVKTIFGVMEFQYDHIAGQFPSWSAPNAYKYLMYYISFPFDVKVSEIFGAGVRGENWIIQKYNGARRAQIGWFAETPTFWETLPGDSTLHANEGYLLLLDRISFNDPSSSIWYKQGSGNSVYLYFPSVSNSIGTIKDANEEVTIKIPSHKCTIERPFTPDIDGWSGGKLVHSNTDSHWNVFGIPLFQSKAATTVGDSELKYFYSWNYTDNTLRPQVTLAGDTVFKSMHGYMVQFAGDVTFTGAHISASVAARRMPSNKHYLAELQLVNENGDENATYVELRENANTDFQLNEDMYMMRSSNTVDLYSFAGAYDVAANVLPIDDQLVRVGVDVKRAGTYRFTMPSEFSGTVTLIDNLMGTRTNMALGDHEVYLERGVDNNRFQLEINIQSSTTSLEGNDVKDGGAHKFIENGQMYILQNGVIYDATGRRVQ